jgi:sulfide:quinone oxidoreductase
MFSLGDTVQRQTSRPARRFASRLPVVVDNIDAFLKNQPLRAEYHGMRRA